MKFTVLIIGFILFTVSVSAIDLGNGYWELRSPVSSEYESSGESYPRGYGSEQGNGQDIGVLLRESSEDFYEERHCGAWVQYYFDEPSLAQINDVYCHIWTKNMISAGISEDESYDLFAMIDGTRKYRKDIVIPGNSRHYDLSIYYVEGINKFYNVDNFIDVSLKVTGQNIQTLSSDNQKSFCIVNPELGNLDSDEDGLTNEEELFTTFTDPFDIDTDDDGITDRQEFVNNHNGWDPDDWSEVIVTPVDGVQNKVYVTVLENTRSKNEVESFSSLLDRELSSEEYGLLSYEDENLLKFVSEASSNRGGLVQLNLHLNPSDSNNELLFFYEGKRTASGSFQLNELGYETMNSQLLGRKGPTTALFFQSIDHNQPYVRLFSNIFSLSNSDSNTKIEANFAEVWEVSKPSRIVPVFPTVDNPLNSRGGLITIKYELIQNGEDVTSEVTSNIMFGERECVIEEDSWYGNGYWNQKCYLPRMPSGIFDLKIEVAHEDKSYLWVEENSLIVKSINLPKCSKLDRKSICAKEVVSVAYN